MHKEVRNFVREVRGKYLAKFVWTRVLEVGSLDINGSVRKHFALPKKYLGIDLGEGKGVDLVHDISKPLPISVGLFDVVISTEMLEHAKNWQACLANMYSSLKPGGLLILTCAAPNRPEHGTTKTTPGDAPYTTDYYRNIGIREFTMILPAWLFDAYFIEERRNHEDLVFFGIKK